MFICLQTVVCLQWNLLHDFLFLCFFFSGVSEKLLGRAEWSADCNRRFWSWTWVRFRLRNWYKVSQTNELIFFYHKLCLANPYIFATRFCRPLVLQTMISVRSHNLSLKYQRFTFSCCKDIGLRTFEFVAKNKFLKRSNWPNTARNLRDSVSILVWSDSVPRHFSQL